MSDQRSGGGGRPAGGGGIAEKLPPSAGLDGLAVSAVPIRTLPESHPDSHLSRSSAAETSLSLIATASLSSAPSAPERSPNSECAGNTRPAAYPCPGSVDRALAGHDE